MGYPKVGETYSGRYRIERLIGHGGMGAVYEAVDTVLDRSVALKIVLPSLTIQEDFHARFAREASVLARIRSRNIVGIHEYGQHEDTVYFVTELFRDGDLRNWLAEHGPLDRRGAVLLVAQVCEALADAHAAGVIHRDVKPGNVLLWQRSEGLVPYLCDFGIALDGTAEQEGLTRTGTMVGSPAYMAPERHFGHPADERSDVYSAGCLLWAALTGDAPYSGTDFQTINAHINAPVPQLATGDPLDERIDAVLAAALHKDPDQRVTTAIELRNRLLDILDRVAPAAPPLPPPATSAPPVAAAPAAAPEHTVIRPVGSAPGTPALGTQPPATPPPGTPTPPAGTSGPGEGDPAPAPGRHRRRGVAAVAAVVAAVALVGGGTAAVLALGDDGDAPPVATDSPTATDAASEAGSSETTTLAQEPPAPRVRASPGYRSVVFAAQPPPGGSGDGVEQRLEYDLGRGWQATGRTVRVATEQGGDRACVRARTVAVDPTGAEVPGDPVRRCGQAQVRRVRLVRTETPCTGVENGYTYPCQWYGVEVEGFASGTSPLAKLRRAGSAQWCVTGFECKRVRVGEDGRGALAEYFKIYTDSGVWEVDVDGVQNRLDLTFD